MNTSAPSTLLIISTCIVSTVHDRPNRASQRDPELGSSGSSTSCITYAISLEWFLDVLAFFAISLEWFLGVSAFFFDKKGLFYEGQWVWCTLDTPDAKTHLRLYVVLDKKKISSSENSSFFCHERIFSKMWYTPVGFVGAVFKGLFYTDTSEKWSLKNHFSKLTRPSWIKLIGWYGVITSDWYVIIRFWSGEKFSPLFDMVAVWKGKAGEPAH